MKKIKSSSDWWIFFRLLAGVMVFFTVGTLATVIEADMDNAIAIPKFLAYLIPVVMLACAIYLIGLTED